MNTNIKKVAVVGAKGFIGSRLVEVLKAEGHDVVALDLPEVDIRHLDSLLLRDVLQGVDVVYHLAVFPLTNCNGSYRKCIETNILGTANILESLRKYGVKRMIYASASSVYGTPEQLPVTEDAPKHPLTMYGVSKLASEFIILNYAKAYERYFTAGIFRFTNVYGPGQKSGLIPSVIQKLMRGETVDITGSGNQTRDFVYVDDVVNILVKALDHPACTFVANLGSGQDTSVNDVVDMCAKRSGIDTETLHVISGDDSQDGDRRYFQADISRLNELYCPLEFLPLGCGLTRTIKWWKEITQTQTIQADPVTVSKLSVHLVNR